MTEKSFPGADFDPHRATCPSCGKTYLQDQPWKKVCLPCYLRTKGKSAPPACYTVTPAAPFDGLMLKRLIQLCHPDRHGNSEASNTATRFLLQLREVQHG